jgi:hypothetical protein
MGNDEKADANCLSCLHFERTYRSCKFDAPRGPKALRAAGIAPRISATTDPRFFRCGDYLAWETALLPFTTPAKPVASTASGDAGG